MSKSRNSVALWLFTCAGMVVVMMLIGAATRLTESGLSMVEWRPLIGGIPPLSDAEWERVFDLYRQTSEYRLQHAGMELAAFKKIFWWEYIHRLWGRLIGIAFAIPFLWFLYKRAIERPLIPHLVMLFCLGGLQGLIGWWMVKSGFVNRTDVSQYRLVVHLGMAMGILGYLLWMAMGLVLSPDKSAPTVEKSVGWLILSVFSVTILSGGFVAGLNAGQIYNSWPLMGNTFIPADYLVVSSWWRNPFESAAAAQFNHRILAYASFGAAIWFFGLMWKRNDVRMKKISLLVLLVASFQVILGISTLLLIVPVSLGVLHQLGAITLFCLGVISLRLLYPAPSS
ncbi:MAG: heme A synthase [Rhodospirillaceae bacterium]|nr:heme A synthase [Rhodospirillaceae bacterium]